MSTELTKVSQFQAIGDDLIVSMTSEVVDIQKDLEEKYPVESIPTDLSVKENYETVKAALREIKKPRIALEKDRKAIKSVPFGLCKKIDAAAKPIMESLVSLETSWKNAKTEYDEAVEREKFEKAQAENARIETIKSRIEEIRMMPITNMDKDSLELSDILIGMDAILFDDNWNQEEIEKANSVIAETKEKLATLIEGKQAQEEVQRQQEEREAALEEEKRLAEAKAQAEREEQDRKNKIEAERLAKIKAEQEAAAKEAEEKLERERAAFEEEKRIAREKQEAIEREAREVEEKRLAAIKEEQEEKEAKEREKAAREAEEKRQRDLAENLNRRVAEATEAIEAILNGGGDASTIMSAIMSGHIPHVSFN